MEKINSKKNVALLATMTFSSFCFFFFSISTFEHFLLRRSRPLLCFIYISLPFVCKRMCECVWRLFIFSLNFFLFLFFSRHIERKCRICLFRFYLNVAFGILSLTKEIPSENKIFSVTMFILPSLPSYAQSI